MAKNRKKSKTVPRKHIGLNPMKSERVVNESRTIRKKDSHLEPPKSFLTTEEANPIHKKAPDLLPQKSEHVAGEEVRIWRWQWGQSGASWVLLLVLLPWW